MGCKPGMCGRADAAGAGPGGAADGSREGQGPAAPGALCCVDADRLPISLSARMAATWQMTVLYVLIITTACRICRPARSSELPAWPSCGGRRCTHERLACRTQHDGISQRNHSAAHHDRNPVLQHCQAVCGLACWQQE
jgi:hypothetical protein